MVRGWDANFIQLSIFKAKKTLTIFNHDIKKLIKKIYEQIKLRNKSRFSDPKRNQKIIFDVIIRSIKNNFDVLSKVAEKSKQR